MRTGLTLSANRQALPYAKPLAQDCPASVAVTLSCFPRGYQADGARRASQAAPRLKAIARTADPAA